MALKIIEYDAPDSPEQVVDFGSHGLEQSYGLMPPSYGSLNVSLPESFGMYNQGFNGMEANNYSSQAYEPSGYSSQSSKFGHRDTGESFSSYTVNQYSGGSSMPSYMHQQVMRPYQMEQGYSGQSSFQSYEAKPMTNEYTQRPPAPISAPAPAPAPVQVQVQVQVPVQAPAPAPAPAPIEQQYGGYKGSSVYQYMENSWGLGGGFEQVTVNRQPEPPQFQHGMTQGHQMPTFVALPQTYMSSPRQDTLTSTTTSHLQNSSISVTDQERTPVSNEMQTCSNDLYGTRIPTPIPSPTMQLPPFPAPEVHIPAVQSVPMFAPSQTPPPPPVIITPPPIVFPEPPKQQEQQPQPQPQPQSHPQPQPQQQQQQERASIGAKEDPIKKEVMDFLGNVQKYLQEPAGGEGNQAALAAKLKSLTEMLEKVVQQKTEDPIAQEALRASLGLAEGGLNELIKTVRGASQPQLAPPESPSANRSVDQTAVNPILSPSTMTEHSHDGNYDRQRTDRTVSESLLPFAEEEKQSGAMDLAESGRIVQSGFARAESIVGRRQTILEECRSIDQEIERETPPSNCDAGREKGGILAQNIRKFESLRRKVLADLKHLDEHLFQIGDEEELMVRSGVEKGAGTRYNRDSDVQAEPQIRGWGKGPVLSPTNSLGAGKMKHAKMKGIPKAKLDAIVKKERREYSLGDERQIFKDKDVQMKKMSHESPAVPSRMAAKQVCKKSNANISSPSIANQWRNAKGLSSTLTNPAGPISVVIGNRPPKQRSKSPKRTPQGKPNGGTMRMASDAKMMNKKVSPFLRK
eukprot:TRINITY_DN1919_c0_g1_i3.p1 TRINITY_DN1919_c0_g1~~TRINITY_DN1919_c0_g1_i3.p1  ORF type:complete len:800 (-),score=181.45 TRINITY_DN1919_c0_g1_i3:169-2568(-)